MRRSRHALPGGPAPSLEALEPRILLSGQPILSEFLAINDTGLEDFDGDRPDWIEIHNPGTESVDLTGWKLRDDNNEWVFPESWQISPPGNPTQYQELLTLGPGEYLVVMASGKGDPAQGYTNANGYYLDGAGYLHTNFALKGSGEYLGLLDDANIVIHEYDEYPEQTADISYGIAQDIDKTEFVSVGDSAQYLVPGGGQGDWTSVGFDDTWWQTGETAIGFADTVPGFAVWNYKANTSVGHLDTALQVVDNSGMQSYVSSENIDVINYYNSGGHGHYTVDETDFPGFTGLMDDFVIEARAFVAIPAAGEWSFGVNSDDGFLLAITGATTTAVSNSTAPAGGETISYAEPRGNADTLGVFDFPDAGNYELRLVMYERGGGSSVELFAAPGAYTSFNDTVFDLVGDTANGGLEVFSEPVTGGAWGSAFAALIETDVEAEMKGVNGSMYVRLPFELTDPGQIESLTLRMKYDDGYVAYLNGQEIASRNAPPAPTWDSSATVERTDAQATTWENVDVSAHLGELLAGPNVLAIHAMNYVAADGDFLVLPELCQMLYLGLGEHFFAIDTPGDVNSEGYWLYVEDTKFSVDRGFYDESFDVEITTATEGADIYYTTDGSEPSETHGTLYTTAIPITTTTTVRARAFKTRYAPTNIDTHTYVFLDDVIDQPNDPEGFPDLWGSTPADYEMDPDVITDPAYSELMRDSLLSIPTLSIVTDVENLFGPSGIYSNPGGEGVAWERPVSVEWINTDGTTGFQVDAGLRIYGGAFRGMNLTRKKTFRLLFKSDYGPTKLDFPMFGEDGAATSFDTLILRGGANDAWNDWGKDNTQYIVDEYMRRLQLALGEPAGHGTFVHLYLNGLYWGLYNPVERSEASFCAGYFGGDKEDWDALNAGAPTGESNTTTWNAMLDQVRAGLADNESYQQIQGNNVDGTNNPAYDDLLDVENYIAYMFSNFWGGTGDWPHHNYYAGCRRPPESTGFKYFNWDSEGAIIVWSSLTADRTGVDSGAAEPYAALRQNEEFRMLFADYVHRYLFNDGPATYEAAHALYQELADEVELAIISESARWGDQASVTPYTLEDWQDKRDYVLNTYMPRRPDIVLNQMKAAGFYPDVVAPSFNINGSYQHGGTILPGDSLTIDAPAGTIYYTTNGTDPRELYGAISPEAVAYSGAVTLAGSTHLKARVYDNGEWSALNEATFYVDLAPNIRITEIMYHPAEATPEEIAAGFANDDLFEFIEIENISATETLPLGDLRFTDGIDFTFPDISIAPGEYVVVVKDRAAFSYRYDTFGGTIAGEYAGSLNNGGERVRLDAPVGGIIHDFDYGDGWYGHTDGDGFSLTIRDPLGASELWGQEEGWRASAAPGGTPGGDDVLIDPGSIIINEVLAHSDHPFVDMIELYNTTDSPIDVSGWFLSDQKTNDLGEEVLTKYQIPTLPAIEAGGYLVLREDTHFGTAFALSELGDDVYLSSDAGGVAGGYREHVDFGASPRNVSVGLHTKSTGGTDFTLLAARSFGSANAYPYIEDLVINEVMYHPLDPTPEEIAAGFTNDDDFEFLEIHNDSPNKTYTLSDFYVGNGVGFTFGWYGADGAGNEAWTLEPGATATWNATLPAGLDAYEVFARWDLLDALGDTRELDGRARYLITHDGGSTEVIRDQEPELDDEGPDYMDPDGWVSLGTYGFNGAGQVVLTRGTDNPTNWTIADQVKFVGATHTEIVDGPTLDSWYTANGPATIGPGEYVVIVRSRAAFDERCDIAGNGIPVVGEYTGQLSNNGNKVELFRVGEPEPGGFIPYYRIDYVNYDDDLPWPTEPDGSGAALNRIDPALYGNDPINWQASIDGGTPGLANVAIDRTPPSMPENLAGHVTAAPDTIWLTWDPAHDAESFVDHYVIYRDDEPLATSTTNAYEDADVLIATPYRYEVSAVNRDGYEGDLSAAAVVTVPGIASYAIPDTTHIEITFTEAPDRGTAEVVGNYVFTGGTLLDVELALDEVTVILTTDELIIGSSYSVTVHDVTTLSGNEMPDGQQIAFCYEPQGSGYILREYWTGIGGGSIGDLTSSHNYPDDPSGRTYPSSLEGPVDWTDDYGTRMRGYIHPPTCGDYTFWIAGDDNSELWLSTDEDPANAVLIASVPGWTGWREWTKYASQQSLPITLTAGQKYYVEVLHKEGGGGDSISVRWQLPDGSWENPANPNEPIPGVRLSPWGGLPDLTPPSVPDGLSAEVAGESQIDLIWDASSDPESGVDHYVIYRDGTAYDTSPTAGYSDTGVSAGARHTYEISAVNPDDFESPPSAAISIASPGLASVTAVDDTSVRLVFTEPLDRTSAELAANYDVTGETVSAAVLGPDNVTVTLTTSPMAFGGSFTVTVDGVATVSGNPLPPGLQKSFYCGGVVLWEYWLGISGTSVANLTGSGDYPDNPSGYEYRAPFETPTNWADDYGGRMRGYVHPDATGDYTFWIASDDNGQLWLSTDEDPANRQLIAWVPVWSSSRDWDKYAEQQSSPVTLQAGQRYYIEALQKEGGGGDNLAVAWEPPGTTFDPTSGEPIDGSYLSPYVEAVGGPGVTVTVDPLTTSDATPALTGAVNDPGVTITVHVGGRYYAAGNNGDDTWTLPDNAIQPALADGTYEVTICAADAAGRVAFDTSTEELVISAGGDVTPPTADVTDVTPDPRTTPVDQIEIVFSEPVTGLDLPDLGLTLDGGAELLTGGESLSTSDHVTWTLAALGGKTAAPGTYTLVLTAAGSGIEDAAGNPLAGDASDSWVMGVAPPENVQITGPAAADEGELLGYTGSATGSGQMTYTWDVSKAGVWGYAGDSGVDMTAFHFTPDDNETYGVKLTVTNEGGSESDTLTVTVGNVGPVVDAGTDRAAAEGETVTFSGSFTDAGSGDTHTIEWDFGDGGTATGPLTPAHVYADDGVYPVTLTVTDDDGGVASDALTVRVSNVPPALTVVGDQTVNEGELLSLPDIGTFTDPGFDNGLNVGGELVETFAYTIDWGDGTPPDGGAATIDAPGAPAVPTTGSFDGSHVYADDGTYTVTVTVTDDDGGSDAEQFNVTVMVVDTEPPTLVAWSSAAEHAGVGEVLLEVSDDGGFSESRMAGVTRLVIGFSEAIDPMSLSPSSVLLAGNDVNSQPVDLSGIIVTTSTRGGDTVGVIDFAPALPDVVRYLVQIEGVTDAAGNPLSGDNNRILTALSGDANSDLRVNAIDLSYIWPRRTTHIDGVTVEQTRSDVTGDGRVNAIDLSATWPRRGPNMQNVSDPVLPGKTAGAGTSQGAFDAAAALWPATQEAASPAEADSATQPTETVLSAPPGPTSNALLPPVSASPEPVDVLAMPAEGQTEDDDAGSAPANLDVDLLDLLDAAEVMLPLEA